MIETLKNPNVRKYIYNVIAALLPFLALAGIILPDQGNLVLLLIASILGLGGSALASANTPNGEAASIDVHLPHDPDGSTEQPDRLPQG